MKSIKKSLAAGALASVVALTAFPIASQAESFGHNAYVCEYENREGCEHFDVNCHTVYMYEIYGCTVCLEADIRSYTYYEEHSYDWTGDRFLCECGDF